MSHASKMLCQQAYPDDRSGQVPGFPNWVFFWRQTVNFADVMVVSTEAPADPLENISIVPSRITCV